MKYKVRIETIIEADIIIEANSLEEAEELAECGMATIEYVGDAVGFVSTQDGVRIENVVAPNPIDVYDIEKM